MSGKMTKRSTAVRAYQSLQGHPLGDLVVEDLAASREHGRITGRVGIAADGQPVIYARSESTAKQLGEAVRRASTVHVRSIPELTMAQFEVLASQKMLSEGEGEDE